MRVRGRGNSCFLVLGILFWISFLGGWIGMDDDEMNDFFLLPAFHVHCLLC